jgi:hypothetical protein
MSTFRAPERVMLCVMPEEKGSDDLIHMQHVLIEAHCREHRIPLVKVHNHLDRDVHSQLQ